MIVFITGNIYRREGWGLDSQSDCSHKPFVSSVTRFVELRMISASLAVCHGNTIYRKTKDFHDIRYFPLKGLSPLAKWKIEMLTGTRDRWESVVVFTLPSQWIYLVKIHFAKCHYFFKMSDFWGDRSAGVKTHVHKTSCMFFLMIG